MRHLGYGHSIIPGWVWDIFNIARMARFATHGGAPFLLLGLVVVGAVWLYRRARKLGRHRRYQ